MYGLDDAAREKIQKLLRSADELFKVKNYSRAQTELDQVLAIDPRNPLARTFMERVKAAIKLEQPVAGAPVGNDRSALLPQMFKDVDQFIARKEFDRAVGKVREILAIEPSNFYAKAYLDNIEKLKNARPAAPPPVQAPVETKKEVIPQGSVTMYREMLKEFWFDGKISPEEEEQLKSVRAMFSISPEEHTQVEREVKLSAYVNALQMAWKDGVVTENEQNVLHMMRQRYSISSEEHHSLEAKIEVAKRTRKSRGTVLLVDSDMESLSFVMGELKKRNYDAIVTHYVEDALSALVRKTPDLIMSEVLFDDKSANGFAFYKKLQELPNFKRIPFYFMSSLNDDKIIRAGIRLGVQKFFVKPLDMKLIIATMDSALHFS
ncbi:MAG: response regulator [Bacteroidota bacterium]